MTNPTPQRLLKYLIYGFGHAFIVFKPITIMAVFFAKMIGNPDAILTSTLAILSALFGLIGAIAAIGSMPSVRSKDFDRWMLKRFIQIVKYQRERHHPTIWLSEAIGIFLFFFLSLKEENRVDPILSIQAIIILSFVWIPIWKGIWTFISYTIPAFLFRSFTGSNQIKNLQKKFNLGFTGFKIKYRLRYAKTIFLLGFTGTIFSYLQHNSSSYFNYTTNVIIVIALAFPTLAILSRIVLECPQIRDSNLGQKIGIFALRWLLAPNQK